MVPLSMTMKIYHSMGRAMKGPSLEFKNRLGLGSRLIQTETKNCWPGVQASSSSKIIKRMTIT
jgi:hypothetical protein